MAVPRGTRFEVEHDQVFPEDVAAVGPVSADMEYVSKEDRVRGKQPKQRMLDKVQPVPPETAIAGFDFRLVYFDGLTIEPRVMGEKFKYLGWVFRVTGMRAPSGAVKGHSKPPLSPPVADKSAA
jgi:hypothetical protein